LFAGLVLAGVDHWTVSSVSPELADLPGISAAVRARLRDAGWTDVFRLARAPAAEVAYRARITPDEALAARQAARPSALRGHRPTLNRPRPRRRQPSSTRCDRPRWASTRSWGSSDGAAWRACTWPTTSRSIAGSPSR